METIYMSSKTIKCQTMAFLRSGHSLVFYIIVYFISLSEFSVGHVDICFTEIIFKCTVLCLIRLLKYRIFLKAVQVNRKRQSNKLKNAENSDF